MATLPAFLRERRERLRPETTARRRTPGLRREEVAARAGESEEARALIAELTATSPDFRRLWAEGDLRPHGKFEKVVVRPGVGEILLASEIFHVDGAEGLSLFVWSPADEASAEALAAMMSPTARSRRP